MTKVAGFEIHPACLAMPEMPDEEFAVLKADMKANGQLCPIEVYKGKVIDGRHRLRACKELRLEPWTVETQCNDMEPTAYVVSLNFARRHLSASQRAAIAADLLPTFEEEAKERQKTSSGGTKPQLTQKVAEADKGEAREKAAAVTGVNKQYVSDAKKIKEADPETFADVKAGKTSIPAAKKKISGGNTFDVAEIEAAAKDDTADLAKKNRALAHAHRDKLARAICDYHELNPNRKERDRLVKLVQGVELW